MTIKIPEEVIEKVAREICNADGVHPDALKHHFPDTYYWQDYIPHATSALTAAIKSGGVVEASKFDMAINALRNLISEAESMDIGLHQEYGVGKYEEAPCITEANSTLERLTKQGG